VAWASNSSCTASGRGLELAFERRVEGHVPFHGGLWCEDHMDSSPCHDSGGGRRRATARVRRPVTPRGSSVCPCARIRRGMRRRASPVRRGARQSPGRSFPVSRRRQPPTLHQSAPSIGSDSLFRRKRARRGVSRCNNDRDDSSFFSMDKLASLCIVNMFYL